MNTPRKSFNYNSPYTRPVQAYPSQSEDYISLDMGGLKTQQQPIKTAQSTNYNETTPGHYSGKYYQQNQRNSHHKNNRHNSFNNNYNNAGQNNNRQQNFKQQHQRFTPRNNKQPYSHDGGAGGQQQQRQRPSFKSHNDDNNSSIASYVHPSMTEDPWCNLMRRAQALRNSSINLKDKSSLETNSTSADSDNASDEVADDSLTALTD